MIYLDHAAATPLDQDVFALMTPYMTEKFHNPSSLYLAARETRVALENARQDIAQVLGAKSGEIIFTSGGTEANNLAIHGVMGGGAGKNIVVGAIEHESVLSPAEKYDRRIAPVRPDGRIDLQKLEALIDQNTAMVSIMYANNEIGSIQPLKDIADIIRTKEKTLDTEIIFHTDAAQAANYLNLHVGRLDVDLMTLNSGKLYGPRAVGCLYVRTGLSLNTQLLGGGQESGRRSGTENVAGAVGFAAALIRTQMIREAETKRLSAIRWAVIGKLHETIPEMLLNSPHNHCLPNAINITIPNVDGEALVMAMDQQGVQLATGSACHASSDLPSHVLTAIGRSRDEASASIRITMGRDTTEEMMSETVKSLQRCLKQLRDTGYVVK